MIKLEFHKNETERQKAVNTYNLLDTNPEEDYDNITEIISGILEVPIALITLLDHKRNFFKSHRGLKFNEYPKENSFCKHAILKPKQLMVVKDARLDKRFHDNPLVKDYNVVFYAGISLISPEGFVLGTICACDTKPKQLTPFQSNALKSMAKQVIKLFELRKKNAHLKQAQIQLAVQNENLKNFAIHVSRDMKMPLSNIILTTDVLKQKYKETIDLKGLNYISNIKKVSLKLSDYINGLLSYYETNHIENYNKSITFSVNNLLENLLNLLSFNSKCVFKLPKKDLKITCNQVALEQIFLNLIGNSIKYNNKAQKEITITSQIKDNFAFFEVTDNGNGIPNKELDEIFNLFSTAENLDQLNNKDYKIRLSTIKKIVESLGGEITVNSIFGKSTTFMFSVNLNND